MPKSGKGIDFPGYRNSISPRKHNSCFSTSFQWRAFYKSQAIYFIWKKIPLLHSVGLLRKHTLWKWHQFWHNSLFKPFNVEHFWPETFHEDLNQPKTFLWRTRTLKHCLVFSFVRFLIHRKLQKVLIMLTYLNVAGEPCPLHHCLNQQRFNPEKKIDCKIQVLNLCDGMQKLLEANKN